MALLKGAVVLSGVLTEMGNGSARGEDVGIITRWLGETNPDSNFKMPAVLLENGYHDNPHDAAYILEPEFQQHGGHFEV